jgi:transcriptional regulator with XRE-family HTH domain
MTPRVADPLQLGRLIHSLRTAKGLSQEALAEPDYTAAYVSHIEHGKRRPSQEALEHFAQRLGVSVEQLRTGRDPNDDLRLELQIQQAIARLQVEEPAGPVTELRRCAKRARATGHRRAELRALEGLGTAHLRLGDLDAAIAAFSSAQALAGDHSEERTTALVGEARCLFQRGDVRDAIHLLESQLIDLRSRPTPDPGSLVELYAALIPAYFESGMIDRAKDASMRGCKLASRVEDPEKLACLHMNRAGLALTNRDRRGALAALALAEDAYRQLGWQAQQTKVELAKAMVHIDDDDMDAADHLLSRLARPESQQRLTAGDRSRCLTQLALVRRHQGRLDEASALVSEALGAVEGRIPIEAAEAHREAGLVAYEVRDGGTAERNWRAALQLFLEAGHHEEAAKTARLLAEYLRGQARLDDALDVYAQATMSLESLR